MLEKTGLKSMASELYKAAVSGNQTIFSETNIRSYGESQFLSRSPQDNNIIHIAAEYGHLNFIDEALRLFPSLAFQKNKNHDTPLHVAARKGHKAIIKFLLSFRAATAAATATATAAAAAVISDDSNADAVAYHMEKNKQGDTFIHVALKSNKVEAVCDFKEVIANVCNSLNKSGESLLHLLVRYCNASIINNNSGCLAMFDHVLEVNKFLVCLPDNKGLTPLLRAASNGDLAIVNKLLRYCPQSVEVCDIKGKTALHLLKCSLKDYKELKELVLKPEFDSLKDRQDTHENTPAHAAIKDGDYVKVRILLDNGADFNIKNIKGVSAQDLICQQSHQLRLKEMEALIRKKELETHDKGFRVKMDDMLYKKVIAWGGTNALEQGDMDFLSSQTKEGTTVLHLAIKNGHTSLVEEALKRCPSLIIMRDLNGDNPLHIAARYDNFAAKIVVHLCQKYVEKHSANVTVPWSTKNLRGYTPLHEALRTSNFEVLFDIFNLNAFGWQCLLEDDTETPLHILARYATPISMELYPSIEKLVKAMEWAIYKRDSEGLTPLMRAAQCGNVFVALVIVLHNTQCVELCDSKGRTFLHLLRLKKASKTDSATKHHIFSICKHMIDIFGVHTLIYSRDCDGNTPLHLAIIDQDFDTAYIVLHKYFDSATEPNKGRLLTSIRNDQGKSIADLIHSYPNVTTDLKRLVEQALSKRVLDEKLLMALRTGDEGAVQNRASNNAFDPSNDEVIQQSMDDDMFSYYESGISFINSTLNLSPELIWQRDSNGDSPMHIAARLQTDGSCKFVELSCSIFQTWVDNDDIRKFALGPLMLRNCRGNAFLHEAVRASNYKVLTFVFERLPIVTVETLTASVNDCGETPLHIAARYALYTDENVITSLRKLIKGSKNVVHMKDVEGFTPILRAILSGQLRIACMILDIHPECLETYDDKGRTILHHLRSSVVELVDDSIDILHIYWEQIFNNHPKLNGLRCVQDKNGNTPLHLALICGDVAAANFLMEKCLTSKDRQELTIINNEGHSIFDLLSSQPHIGDMKLRKNRTFKEMIKATNIDNTVMDEKLYKATMKGEASIFDVSKTDIESGLAKQHEDAYFLSKTLDGSNILHLAIKYSSKDNKQDLEHVEFVNKALDRFPCLMLEQNTAGNNPLHLAARFRGAVSDRVLQFAVKQVIESNSYCTSSALFRKNGEGNLPIHEAIRCCNESAIVKLLEYYNEVIASQVNHRGETPLHVYADCGFYFEVEDVEYDVVKVLITGNNVVPYTRDFEGLTPLLRAAKSGNILALRRILEYCPQSAELCDPYGKNFMHLLHLTGKYTIGEDSSDILFEMLGNNLFKLISQADGQRLVQDCDGNTPLHYAIKTKNFNLAKALSKRCVDSAYNQELRILNYAGETTSNMLASYGVPDEIVSHIKKKKQLTGFLSGRSSYGVRKQNLKDSVYSLFIIAGLLASITFGAAFQVPGGYNGDDGYPVLRRKAAFQVFLLSDTLAMCGSMIVLFSLLWVMFCSNIYDSFKLLDLSMTLLQLSFYATIVAFMSGVYTSTAEDILWLAISVCGLCSFVILISWKFVILTVIKRLRLVRDMYTSTGKLSIEEYKKAHGKHIGVSFDELSTF